MAQYFFGPGAGSIERSLIKRYLHAINYGQTKEGFVGNSCFDLETTDAEARYEAIQTAFPALLRWRKAQAQFAKSSGYVATTGGWTRNVSSVRNFAERQNIVSSTLAQGLAADIFRWCLLELDKLLPQLDSFIVFQNHDEVFIAAPPEQVANVKQLALQVFEQDVATQTSLIPNGVQLNCKVKDGATWADLI